MMAKLRGEIACHCIKIGTGPNRVQHNKLYFPHNRMKNELLFFISVSIRKVNSHLRIA